MDRILQGLQTQYVAIHIDDIKVYITSQEQQKRDLEDVLWRLEAASLCVSVFKTH